MLCIILVLVLTKPFRLLLSPLARRRQKEKKSQILSLKECKEVGERGKLKEGEGKTLSASHLFRL